MNAFFKAGISVAVTFSLFFIAESAWAAPTITLQKAQEIAASHANIPLEGITFTESSLDSDFMSTEYEIEFFVNNVEYEYEIDANTGEIVSYSQEKHGVYAQPNQGANYISEEQAKQIALKHANISSTAFSQIEFDIDDGIAVYEVEFFANNSKYEYEINAVNSEIIGFGKE